MIANPGKVITRYTFSQVFSKAWVKSMTMQNIITSFVSCGSYSTNSIYTSQSCS
jgi:hypothetical protein